MLERITELLTEIFSELTDFLNSKETLEKSRLSPAYFTRTRKLGFVETVLFLMAHFPGSLDSELREYFECLGRERSPVSESTVSHARNHMSAFPFKRMFEIVRDRFIRFDQAFLEDPHHMVYCGIDGSVLALPDFRALAGYFGTSGGNSPSARVSLIFDSVRHFIFFAVLEPMDLPERDLALYSVRRLGDMINLSDFIFIFDRGYPSLDFCQSLSLLKTNFIIRVPEKWFGLGDLETEPFNLEDGVGYRVYFEDGLMLRAIRLSLSTGRTEALLTNLFEVPSWSFGWLYGLRWPIEIEYYFLKHVIRLEDFNGYTPESVIQNFWIAATLSNIASIFRMAAQIVADEKRAGKENKYYYQINFSEMISILHPRIIELLTEENEKERRRRIEDTIQDIARFVVPVRKEVHKERSGTRNVFYHFNRKVH